MIPGAEKNSVFTQWPNAWSDSTQVGFQMCPISSAQVCLYNYDTGSPVACVTTAITGEYSLAAPPGIRISVRVTYQVAKHKHEDQDFKRDRAANINVAGQVLLRANPGSVAGVLPQATDPETEEVFTFIPETQAFAAGMDYQDHTTRVL